jgi:nitrogenase iron protein NifH
MEDMVCQGFGDVVCVEAGGPAPGQGCAGRGIIAALEKLESKGVYAAYKPDVVIYDVLGDVVCGGFAMPIREGYADHVLIVTSGENMAVYAAANIACAIENFRERGYASLAGVVLNRRNVPNEREKVEELCGEIRSEIVCDLPRDNRVAQAEESRKPVMEMFPGIPYADEIRRLADYILTLPEGEDE